MRRLSQTRRRDSKLWLRQKPLRGARGHGVLTRSSAAIKNADGRKPSATARFEALATPKTAARRAGHGVLTRSSAAIKNADGRKPSAPARFEALATPKTATRRAGHGVLTRSSAAIKKRRGILCLSVFLAQKARFELALPYSSTTPLAGEPLEPLGYFCNRSY